MAGKTQTDPAKVPRQSTLLGFFGKPKPGPAAPSSSARPLSNKDVPVPASAPVAAGPSTSSPASTALRTPSSALGSSPSTVIARSRVRSTSPLKNVMNHDDDLSDDLTPPPLEARKSRSVVVEKEETVKEDIVMNHGGEDSPIVLVSWWSVRRLIICLVYPIEIPP
ncbi:hypothetical protein BD324DRAFT_214492 [Kockovaella imperatae]|uniref:Uncharacterized protein n=1 Tax=Kockovaella imperatae TaxID=4999 RepID=A0A1Y1U7N7_9TREE|nr:hypothetical protein BD324DRAFT_214492 [Kockovaella imperatae]ORX33554.1 hypothetical protein BD324DRAFT_214492 [Kockovaella imperatae]